MKRHKRARRVTRPEDIPATCTIDDVCAALNICKSQFFNLRRQGTFPIPEIAPPMDRKPRFSGALVRAYINGELAPKRRRAG